MWLRTDGWGFTPAILDQLRAEVPDAPAIAMGESASWLNLDTGARMLHVMFGSILDDEGRHGIFYRAPSGEMLDIAHPVLGLQPYEMKLNRGRQDNSSQWRTATHTIERTLGFRDDEFTDRWPTV